MKIFNYTPTHPREAYLFRRQVLAHLVLLFGLLVVACLLLRALLTIKPCVLLLALLMLWSQ